MNVETDTVRAWWRQPLLHFILAGAAIFGLDALRGSPDSASGQRIVVTASHVERLAEQWQMTWGRAPGDAEIQALVRNYVKEEVYYREAIKLGLDVNDSVIRQRLGRKMEFFAVPELSENDAEDGELLAFYSKNIERYRKSPVLSFEQVYFSNAKEAELEQALKKLHNGLQPSLLGDAIGLPRRVDGGDKASITRTFGSEFYSGLQSLEKGSWSGPVSSGFGQHLVKISSQQEARRAEFSEVREAVVNDWLARKNVTLQNEAYERLRATYEIEIDVSGE